MNVLILSSSEDPHTKKVVESINEFGDRVDLFRYQEVATTGDVFFTLGQKNQCTFERSEAVLDLHSYESIWHRRPGQFKVQEFSEGWITDMALTETRAAIDGILRTLPCFWLNLPARDQAANSKMWQLSLAQSIGLDIPDTLVTNAPEKVSEFFEKCNGEVIYKLISDQSGFFIPASESPSGISTMMLRREDLKHLAQVKHCPHLFQRYVNKSFELRVTIVGTEIFTVSIDSQSGNSKIDWRNDYSVEMTEYALPDNVKIKCLKLMKRLGLNYGAMDFVVTPDGRFVFLEINPAGQYLWIEDQTQLPISRQIALLLTNRSERLTYEPDTL